MSATRQDLCALSTIFSFAGVFLQKQFTFQKVFCCSAPMATSSTPTMTNSLCAIVATNLKDLLNLIFSILPKLLGLSHSLLRRLQKDEYFHPPQMELETSVCTLPELPQDVLMSIFATLEIPDLIRAGSVCLSWHSAYTCLRNLGKYKQPQTPCLLYTSESAGENVAFMYSLVEKRAYKLTLPEPPIRRRLLVGSSYGWLITADERSELHLLNPITGEQIELPSVTTIEHVKPIFDDSGSIHKYELSYHTAEKVYGAPSLHTLDDLGGNLYYKAFVFPDPSTGSYFVVLIHSPFFQLSFARAGDDKWTWLPPNTDYRDCICMGGLLYASTIYGVINAFDLTASTVITKIILDEVWKYRYANHNMYIIWAPWGDLLQVWRAVSVPEHEEDGYAPKHGTIRLPYTMKLTVYKVDLEAKELVETKSLNNHMLFLGHNNSMCLSADEHPQLKENHAYFTDDNDELIMVLKNATRDIGVIDLESSKREEIISQIGSNWPCPTWLTPNITKMNLAFSN